MAGVVDALRRANMPAFGPTSKQARLEGDKSFMRDLLSRKVGWGSPQWRYVKDTASARAFIEQVGPVAVKPVGLTGGKGVRVMGVHLHSLEEAAADAATWIDRDGGVLLEERLIGEEFSRMRFVSGSRSTSMPVAQDFKYAYDGDQGGMTGGMGAYTMQDGSMPFLSPSDLEQADRLMDQVVQALEEETGEPYCGFLYGQFMAVRDGVRVIEFNARLGDPEAINVMALLEGGAAEILLGAAEGNLEPNNVSFAPQASVVKYLVPKSYPDSDPGPQQFYLDEARIESAGLSLVFASVRKDGHQWETLGSRSLALVGLGADAGAISETMEELLKEIEPSVLRHRRDVGASGVIQSRVERMRALRGGARR
jgi:phosphoribosylamine---glycine ligase